MTSSPLADAWLRGVAANPGAPAGVLLRLLDPAAHAVWAVLCGERALPAAVIEAVVAHPSREVRQAFARNRFVAPEQRGRMVDDPDALVRVRLASGPRPRFGAVEALPDDVLEVLLTARDGDHPGAFLTADEIAAELAFSQQIPQSFRRGLPGHPNPRLRAQAASLWLALTDAQREALLADAVPAVAEAARRNSRVLDPLAMEADLPDQECHSRNLILINYAVSPAMAQRCLAERRDLRSLAGNRHTPAEIVARLARDPDPQVRERVASRADVGPALLAELAQDPDSAVRARALLHPLPRTWAQRSAIDRVIGLSAECVGPAPEMFVEPETSWYEACAGSPEAVLRRVAATCPRLPEGLVHRLARDPDPDVRHILAYNHPLAPPATVLDAFIATPRQRPYLLTLPRLPRTGLADLLDHEDAEVRALAAADSGLARPPVHRLADPDPRVRRAAAANPRLPRGLVESLLADPGLAEGAAANPALSAERLHALLDRSGLPAGPRSLPSVAGPR
ncbi:hypothetical protein [Streptomyces sp. NRRL S-350]|uniref:hypothetical protein n=1 Tax=Streptomyces sp. NRRL S-350 TaxID=1463902 RepID=UPI00068D5EF6|nr:hypothetical protein [Streptomyces sp. NRRL S-350]